MIILIVLILSIHEHSISFHLFCCLEFFHQCLKFANYRSFTSLVRFIPQYFIHFHAIGTEIVFLTSLSDSILL